MFFLSRILGLHGRSEQICTEPAMVFGMPVIYREKLRQQYFVKSIKQLIQCLTPGQRLKHHLVVCIADTEPWKVAALNEDLDRYFGAYKREGFLSIVQAGSLNDKTSPWRDELRNLEGYKYWRAKLSLDAVSLLQFVSENHLRFSYYVHLEDDILVNRRYFSPAALLAGKTKIEAQHSGNEQAWIAIKFEKRKTPGPTYRFGGFFGLLFPVTALAEICEYIVNHHRKAPVDWLLGDYLISKDSQLHYVNRAVFCHTGKVSTKENLEFIDET